MVTAVEVIPAKTDRKRPKREDMTPYTGQTRDVQDSDWRIWVRDNE